MGTSDPRQLLGAAGVVSDPDASGGEAVVLYSNDGAIRFTVPSSSSTYTVRVRARGQRYIDSPMLELKVNGSRVATNEIETRDYATHTFGQFALDGGQSVEVGFINDAYGGPGLDRNAVVDYMILDPNDDDDDDDDKPAPTPTPTPNPRPSTGLVGDWYVDDNASSGGNGSASRPFKRIKDAMAEVGSGETIVVRPGTYREEVIVDKPLKLLGEPGATIKGSDVWTGWDREGAYWERDFKVSLPGKVGMCKVDSNERCFSAAQVFIDGTPLFEEMSLSLVGPGEFYVGNGKIYLGSDPSGRTVEVSTRRNWVADSFYRGVDNVTVKGFKMLHLANAAQRGGIFTGGNSSSGWLIEDNDLSYAHGAGIRIEGRNHIVRNNKTLYMGELGITGGDFSDVRIEGNEIAYNNTEEFLSRWEAGGLKIGHAKNVTIINNESHHNDGSGLWCDEDCDNVKFIGNRLHHNATGSIQYEISNNCLIEGNMIWEEAQRPGAGGWVWGAGIKVQNSSNCEVKNNVVAWNLDGISVIEQVRDGRHFPTGNSVHDNVIITKNATAQLAYASDLTEPRIDTDAANNRGWNNSYYAMPGHNKSWDYAGAYWSLEDFNETRGEENGRELSWAEAASILASKGMPLAPER